MPAKNQADYMRVYRARKKMPGDPPEIPPEIPENAAPAEKPLEKKSTFRKLPGDGWVAALTQAQRDYLLDRINNPSRKIPAGK